MLINQHHSLTGSHPYAPNVVEVGGLQVGTAKSLPQVGTIGDLLKRIWPKISISLNLILHLLISS